MFLGRNVVKHNVNGKKDKLHVSLEIFKNCLSGYQLSVKAAKIKYISDLISNNSHNIKVLFNTFDRTTS